MESKTKTWISTKRLVITALFIALSFIGANIKILGTIAFDSLPGFVAALLLGPACGMAIGFLGHLLTALTSGFPLTVTMHLVIGAAMAVTMLGFGLTYKALKNKIPMLGSLIITGITGIILNAPVSLAFSMAALGLIAGKEAALGLLTMLPALALASIANIIIAIIVFKALERVRDKAL